MATAAVGAGPRAPPAVLELVAWEPAALVAEETAAPMLLVAAATVWEMRLSSALALLRAAASVAVERKLFQLERAARATATGYLQIVFAGAWGALLLGERPTGWSLAGATLIVGSTLAMVWVHQRGTASPEV